MDTAAGDLSGRTHQRAARIRAQGVAVFDPQRGQMQAMTLFAKPEVVSPDDLTRALGERRKIVHERWTGGRLDKQFPFL